MRNITKYQDNILLDNLPSFVVEDPSDQDEIIENLNSELKTLRNCFNVLGSEVMDEENINTTEINKIPRVNMPVFFEKKTGYSKIYFTLAQNWLGTVFEIRESTFIAKLLDLNSPYTYEIGEFDIKEVVQEDLELFSIGSVFYWSIGMAVSNGQKVKQSFLRFQRLSQWTESEYNKITDRASELLKNLNWDNE